MNIFTIKSSQAMQKLGAKISLACDCGCVIYLHGELGAGKTTFVRGFIHGKGYQGRVKSPTFTLLEPYQVGQLNIYHFDLYRLANPQELDYIGVRDYFSPEAICLVEWPERGKGFLPTPDLICEFNFIKNGREVKIIAKSDNGIKILAKI